MNRTILLIIALIVSSCSSTPKKVIIDSSSPDRPSWIDSNQLIWEKDENILIKASHLVNGNERPDGCLDLAKLDAKENLLTEIKDEIRGRIDSAQTSLSVDAETVLGKVRSSSYEGTIHNLRFEESFWEKYQIGKVEKSVSCFVLAMMKKDDYQELKRTIINQIQSVDPRIKEAITRKQIDFFDTEKDKK